MFSKPSLDMLPDVIVDVVIEHVLRRCTKLDFVNYLHLIEAMSQKQRQRLIARQRLYVEHYMKNLSIHSLLEMVCYNQMTYGLEKNRRQVPLDDDWRTVHLFFYLQKAFRFGLLVTGDNLILQEVVQGVERFRERHCQVRAMIKNNVDLLCFNSHSQVSGIFDQLVFFNMSIRASIDWNSRHFNIAWSAFRRVRSVCLWYTSVREQVLLDMLYEIPTLDTLSVCKSSVINSDVEVQLTVPASAVGTSVALKRLKIPKWSALIGYCTKLQHLEVHSCLTPVDDTNNGLQFLEQLRQLRHLVIRFKLCQHNMEQYNHHQHHSFVPRSLLCLAPTLETFELHACTSIFQCSCKQVLFRTQNTTSMVLRREASVIGQMRNLRKLVCVPEVLCADLVQEESGSSLRTMTCLNTLSLKPLDVLFAHAVKENLVGFLPWYTNNHIESMTTECEILHHLRSNTRQSIMRRCRSLSMMQDLHNWPLRFPLLVPYTSLIDTDMLQYLLCESLHQDKLRRRLRSNDFLLSLDRASKQDVLSLLLQSYGQRISFLSNANCNLWTNTISLETFTLFFNQIAKHYNYTKESLCKLRKTLIESRNFQKIQVLNEFFSTLF